MERLTRLFEPISIGSLTLKNRIIMPAVTTLFDLEGGSRYADFYVERARGGASLIVLNMQALYPGRAGRSGAVPDEKTAQMGPVKINHDAYIPRLRVITQTLADAGTAPCAQLAVYGFWAKDGYGAPAEEVSPSGVVLEGDQYRPGLEKLSFIRHGRPLTVEEIQQIERDVAAAAVRAMKAGFHIIELQSLGGNLLSRFLSPLTNKRDDEYGGSLENRARMLLETARAVKAAVGDKLPLMCRINGDDLLPGGMGVTDYQQLVPLLEDAGVQALNVMPGWYETRQPVNQMCVPKGAFVYAAERLKQVAQIPVFTNIRITDPRLAEQILQEGRADGIAVCSALIADPEWPVKAQEGRLDDIRMCTGCCHCWSELAGHLRPISCSVNARVGVESKTVIKRAEKPKTIWVVGGGPGGMEAARVAALRGHRVTLFERRDELGGQLLFAALAPHKGEWSNLVSYLEAQLGKNGVEVRLGTKLSADEIVAGRPDEVIVATGARPIVPKIPGIDRPNVSSCVDILTGKSKPGQKVAIIGGGCTGGESAEHLAKQGKTVTIIEMLPEVAADVDFWNRWVLLDRLKRARIRMIVNAKAEEISAAGVRITVDGRSEMIEADFVGFAIGARPYNPLTKELEGRFDAVHPIGDCDTPQRVRQAIDAGFRIGNQI